MNDWFLTLNDKLDERQQSIGKDILKEISMRVHLNHVGLDYLTLDRSARTLSGGESQRARLANQIGNYQLSGVLYILTPNQVLATSA